MPSAPAPPDLFTTINGFGDRLYLSMIGDINLAITSAPPPVPAGTTNSTGFVGSHALAVPVERPMIIKEHTSVFAIFPLQSVFFIRHLPCVSLNLFCDFLSNYCGPYSFLSICSDQAFAWRPGTA